jgi:hypothetical protein
MKQRVFWVMAFAWGILGGAALGLDPVSFKELSLFLRMGEKTDFILGAVQQRRMLRPLTEQQLAVLKSEGASDALLRELQRPERVAPAEVADAVEKRAAARIPENAAEKRVEKTIDLSSRPSPAGPPSPAAHQPKAAQVASTPMGRYRRKMSQQLESLWTLKMADLPKDRPASTVRLEAKVLQSGKVTDVAVLEDGGDRAHAEICMAVMRALKLDPLPPEAAPLLEDGAMVMRLSFSRY